MIFRAVIDHAPATRKARILGWIAWGLVALMALVCGAIAWGAFR